MKDFPAPDAQPLVVDPAELRLTFSALLAVMRKKIPPSTFTGGGLRVIKAVESHFGSRGGDITPVIMTAVLAEYFPNKPFPEENALFRRTLAVWCHTEVGHLDCFLSVDVEDDDEDKFNSLHEAVFEVAASCPLDGSGFEMPAFRHAVGFLMKDKYGWLS